MSDTHFVTYLEGISIMNTSAVQPHNEVGCFRGGQYETTPDFSDMTLLEAREYLTRRGDWEDYRVVDDEVTPEIDVRNYVNGLTRFPSGHSIRITEYTADMRLQGRYTELATLLHRQAPMFVELAFADSERMAIGHDSGLQLVHHRQVIPLTAVWSHEGTTYEFKTHFFVAPHLKESDILSEEQVDEHCVAEQQALDRTTAQENPEENQ